MIYSIILRLDLDILERVLIEYHLLNIRLTWLIETERMLLIGPITEVYSFSSSLRVVGVKETKRLET